MGNNSGFGLQAVIRVLLQEFVQVVGASAGHGVINGHLDFPASQVQGNTLQHALDVAYVAYVAALDFFRENAYKRFLELAVTQVQVPAVEVEVDVVPDLLKQ